MKIHGGKIISVAISFLKNASLPGLILSSHWMRAMCQSGLQPVPLKVP